MATGVVAPLVLIAEDYADTRELYALSLKREGYRVVTARDGLEAVALAQQLHPNVIVMDLAMPVMTGWEATSILKDDVETSEIFIIVVTGNGEETDMARGRWDRFVRKPCRPCELADYVRDALAAA